MNTSLKWIKALVPGLDCGVQEYVDAMTLSGSKVEGYEQLDADLDKIVVGQVTKIEKHPDADKLVICQVNVGSETLQIVTGAPNAKPEYSSGSIPLIRSTLGCTIPQPRISIHPSPLQKRHPFPPHLKQETSISADGSVNGK